MESPYLPLSDPEYQDSEYSSSHTSLPNFILLLVWWIIPKSTGFAWPTILFPRNIYGIYLGSRNFPEDLMDAKQLVTNVVFFTCFKYLIKLAYQNWCSGSDIGRDQYFGITFFSFAPWKVSFKFVGIWKAVCDRETKGRVIVNERAHPLPLNTDKGLPAAKITGLVNMRPNLFYIGFFPMLRM